MPAPTGKEAILRKVYFGVGGVLAIPSIIMYVTVPSGTVKYFGGKPSPSAAMWCSLTAGGDAVITMLCLLALAGRGGEEFKKTVVQCNFVYSLFHCGAFWWHHTYSGEPHPSGPNGYIGGIAVALAAFLRWGL